MSIKTSTQWLTRYIITSEYFYTTKLIYHLQTVIGYLKTLHIIGIQHINLLHVYMYNIALYTCI